MSSTTEGGELTTLLRDQRAARDYLAEHPGDPAAVLGLSDAVAEEVLMLTEEQP